jgi:hypothetical protein
MHLTEIPPGYEVLGGEDVRTSPSGHGTFTTQAFGSSDRHATFNVSVYRGDDARQGLADAQELEGVQVDGAQVFLRNPEGAPQKSIGWALSDTVTVWVGTNDLEVDELVAIAGNMEVSE